MYVTAILEMFVYICIVVMSDLFIFDIMVGYVLPIQDESWLFPAVTLKLLNFPTLTVHCISPSQQQELQRKFQNDLSSDIPNEIGIRGSQNHFVFKKGKSCSFKLKKQDSQKLYFPLTIILNDTWYLPVKELGGTCINILVPHFKQGSVIAPVNSNKQVYELSSADGSKVAMIELSYKLKRIQNDVTDAVSNLTDTVSSYTTKPVTDKENPTKKEKSKKSVHIKEVLFPHKLSVCTNDVSVNKPLNKMTVCPPPLLYNASSDNKQVKLQSEVEPDTSQDVNQVVWPNGYIHTEPGKEDDFNTVLLPLCPQYAMSSVAQDEINVSNNQNFWILQALMKELTMMEQLLKSKGVNPPIQKCSDVYVQTDNLCNAEVSNDDDDKTAPSEVVAKKLVRKKKFTRECCTTKLDHLPINQPGKTKPRNINTPPQNKINSSKTTTVYQMASPNKRTIPSVVHQSRTRKVKIKPSIKQKSLNQIQVDSAVSRVSQITSDKGPKSDEKVSEEFSVNTSVEHKGDQSNLNLDIHLPTMTKIPSVATVSLKQGDSISSAAVDTTAALLTVPAVSVTPSVTPLASTMPSAPASQSEHLILTSSNDIQSYVNLSLSESSEDPLNQSRISNLMFSTKHLEAAVAIDNKTAMHSSPTTKHDQNVVDSNSPTTSSIESAQYKDDFESSDCSSKETLSSKT